MSEYRSEHRKKLDGIESVIIFNPVGRIVITGWDEPDLFVDFTVTMPGDQLMSDAMVPEFSQSGKVLSVMPPKAAMSGSGSLDVSMDSENSTDEFSEEFSSGISDFIGKIVSFAQSSGKKVRSGVKSAIDVRLPRNMPITVKNLNGVIAISNMHSAVTAKGLNGPVTLNAITGPVEAKTVNGPVTIEKSLCPELSLKSVNGPVKCYVTGVAGPISLKTVNGPVRMMIPRHSDIDLSAKTFHGAIKISSDFISQTRSSRVNKATLNAGDHPVSIKSTTGSITVITTDEPVQEIVDSRRDKLDAKTGIARSTVKNSETGTTIKAHSDQSADTETKKAAEKTGSPENSLQSQIDRMLSSGKITADEAEKLRKAI